MYKKKILNKKIFFFTCLFFLSLIFYSSFSFSEDLGSVAERIRRTFSQVARLITASAYVLGMGFAIGSILKFKQHKDNPTQIPVGTPIALIFIAASLIFLPTLFSVAGNTLFEVPIAGGINGIDSIN